jgi:hypothetical protein
LGLGGGWEGVGGVSRVGVWYHCGGWLGIIMEGMPPFPFHRFGDFWSFISMLGDWRLLQELALHPVKFTPEVMVHAAAVKSVTEWGFELGMIPRVEPEEVEDGLEEGAGTLSKRYEELMGHRVYPQ